MTKAIIDIATPLGISVHDHIVVGKNGHASLKGMRRSSAGEHLVDIEGVTGSIPVAPTIQSPRTIAEQVPRRRPLPQREG